MVDPGDQLDYGKHITPKAVTREGEWQPLLHACTKRLLQALGHTVYSNLMLATPR